MNVLDMFSGIAGFALGLEAAGATTVAFCEADPHARAILAHHWPNQPEYEDVPIYNDVRSLNAQRLADDGITVDAICGGFPCQDISLSGSGAGLDGARSGLWFEFLRIIDEVRPRWAIIENVAALRSRGLDEVLRGLAAIGYDAEWHCIPASAVGAPHRRDRIWIVAYPHSDAGDERRPGDTGEGTRRRDADRSTIGADVADAYKPRLEIKLHGEAGEQSPVERTHAWSVEPDVGRVAYGVPSRVDRITRLGNAVVPQIPEAIGHAIMRWEAAQ